MKKSLSLLMVLLSVFAVQPILAVDVVESSHDWEIVEQPSAYQNYNSYYYNSYPYFYPTYYHYPDYYNFYPYQQYGYNYHQYYYDTYHQEPPYYNYTPGIYLGEPRESAIRKLGQYRMSASNIYFNEYYGIKVGFGSDSKVNYLEVFSPFKGSISHNLSLGMPKEKLLQRYGQPAKVNYYSGKPEWIYKGQGNYSLHLFLDDNNVSRIAFRLVEY